MYLVCSSDVLTNFTNGQSFVDFIDLVIIYCKIAITSGKFRTCPKFCVLEEF